MLQYLVAPILRVYLFTKVHLLIKCMFSFTKWHPLKFYLKTSAYIKGQMKVGAYTARYECDVRRLGCRQHMTLYRADTPVLVAICHGGKLTNDTNQTHMLANEVRCIFEILFIGPRHIDLSVRNPWNGILYRCFPKNQTLLHLLNLNPPQVQI